MSMSGKSLLVKLSLPQLIRAGVPIIAYSNTDDADYMKRGIRFTRSPDAFENMLKNQRGKPAFIIIDEAPSIFYQTTSASHPLIHGLSASGRHEGWSVRFISQSPTKIPPFTRDNLHALDVFRIQNETQAKAIISDRSIAKHYAETIRQLPPLHYLQIRPMAEPQIKRLILPR